eukprot:364677-Chlamydomonas_euryale.AAC.2
MSETAKVWSAVMHTGSSDTTSRVDAFRASLNGASATDTGATLADRPCEGRGTVGLCVCVYVFEVCFWGRAEVEACYVKAGATVIVTVLQCRDADKGCRVRRFVAQKTRAAALVGSLPRRQDMSPTPPSFHGESGSVSGREGIAVPWHAAGVC